MPGPPCRDGDSGGESAGQSLKKVHAILLFYSPLDSYEKGRTLGGAGGFGEGGTSRPTSKSVKAR